MSVYTTEVRMICEVESGLVIDAGYNDIDEVIEKSWDKIFKKFPIFNETYRPVLCKKILSHYYTREIGAETVGLWKQWLNQRMNEIMPYYNKLYETESLKFDPLNEVNFTKNISEKSNSTNSAKINNENNGELNSTNSTTNESKNVIAEDTEEAITDTGTVSHNSSNDAKQLHSDTPQGTISNIENETYLTDATISSTTASDVETRDISKKSEGKRAVDNSTDSNENSTRTEKTSAKSTVDSNGSSNGEKTIAETYSGKNSSRSYASLITEYRESLLNIDLDIILELRDLFMNIY